jgi:hypothetical protein
MTNEIIQEAINDNTPQMTEDEFDDLVFEFECLINSASEEEFPQLVELWWKLTKIAKVDFEFDLFLSKVPIVPLNRDWDWIKIHIDPLRCASLMALKEGETFHFDEEAAEFIRNDRKQYFSTISLTELIDVSRPSFGYDIGDIYNLSLHDMKYNFFVHVLENKQRDVIEWAIENRKKLFLTDEDIKKGAETQEVPELKELILNSLKK